MFRISYCGKVTEDGLAGWSSGVLTKDMSFRRLHFACPPHCHLVPDPSSIRCPVIPETWEAKLPGIPDSEEGMASKLLHVLEQLVLLLFCSCLPASQPGNLTINATSLVAAGRRRVYKYVRIRGHLRNRWFPLARCHHSTDAEGARRFAAPTTRLQGS